MARTKGAVNKNKQALLIRLQAKYPEYDPVVALADIANDQEQDIQLRFNAHKEIAQYVVPKLKAVQLTGGDDGEGAVKSLKVTWK